MPWCHQCGWELEGGQAGCPLCGQPLSPIPPADLPEEEGLAFLLTAATHLDYELIQSMLDADGIPLLRRPRGNGGSMEVIMGFSLSGYDLFVVPEHLKRARDIVKSARTSLYCQEEAPDEP